MDLKTVIGSQHRAALAMLRQAVEACPDDLWSADVPQNAFWRVAYHAVFYAHLYLQPSEPDFQPWHGHRPESQYLGSVPWPPHAAPKPCAPYSKAEVSAYIDAVAGQVDPLLAAVDLDGESGFDWLPFSKVELQLYTVRHTQQHAGELSDRLAGRGIELDWTGAA
jgi:hypothetical protein